MDNEKPKKMSLWKFVLSDPKFSAFNRAEYVLFNASALAALAMLVTALWYLNFSPWIIAGGLMVFLWSVRITIKFILPYVKTQGITPQETARQEKKMIPIAIIFFIALLVGVPFLLNYRYQALTGHSVLDFFGGTPKNVQPIASDKFVLLQITADSDDLSDNPAYESSFFSFDRNSGTLTFNNFNAEKKLDQTLKSYYTDPEVMVMTIEDNKTGREFPGSDAYTLLPSNLPYFLSFETHEYDRPRLTAIGQNGEIYVTQKRLDLKTLELEKNMMRKNNAGIITETVKIEPNQSYKFIDKTGTTLKLVHLGVFEKSKITYSPAASQTQKLN
ncbi:MAG TPA: hypothetical protein P5080_04675 [Candidatus Paceibacterota bacterium]|nr:hypothetical protein [Candidatus Pacearchaeota archaeon]HRZ51245.1 hypothetical protein [Candidatus Paceibacterota bacterium]HSA36967.1 hypothetical protein [Candidatus Paceibacterota bacterium]